MSGIIDNFLIIGVQAGILVIVIAIFRFLLRKRSKLFVYAMWLILLLRLCVPVTTESRWGIIDRQKPISVDKEYSSDGEGQWQDMYQSDLGSNMVSTTVKQPVSLKDQLEKWESVQKEEIKEGDSSIKFKKEEIVLLAWGMGVVVLLVISIVQYGQFIRKTRFAIKVEDNVWETENISTAFVTGFFRARIYLPTGLLEREREFILQHERVHIKHRDNIIRLIMLVVNIIYWWNPFVWLAIFMMKKDMEMFCDEVVVSALKDVERKEYLNVLLDNSAKISGIIPVMSFGESNTKMRIAHIINLKKSGAMAVFIMICFGIICLTGCTTIAKHQNVSDSAVFTTEETTTEEEATTVKPSDEISTEPIVYVPQEGIYVSENPDSTILIYVDYFGAQIWDVSKLDGGHEP